LSVILLVSTGGFARGELKMSGLKKLKITGWVLSALIFLLLIGPSAMSKFMQWEGKSEEFAKMGWSEDVMFKIGVVEVSIAILFLIPRTAFIAAILLAAYLGGATATHVRLNEPFFAPIIIGVVAWVALGLRNPDVFRLAFGNDSSERLQNQP
jgi:DoxX-like family